MKILVVHRQKDTVDVIKSVLSEKKPVVLQTESGLDGLLTSRIEIFDLIICGTDLPVVTGFELIRSIRTNSVNRNTPVILLKDRMDEKMERLAKALNVETLLPTDDVGHRLADIVQEYMEVLPKKSLTELVTRSGTH
jgi:CheY-like chemotaxis protein